MSTPEARIQIMNHHPVLSQFRVWDGHVPAGFVVNFFGVLTREYFSDRLKAHPDYSKARPSLPAFSEGYFEWIDLLEAVTAATNRFTMIELGAGWGRWLVNGWAATRAYHGDMPCRLIGVEAEPTHHEWAEAHFRDNNVDRNSYEILHAAMSDREGWLWFHVGRPADWYGQAIARDVRAVKRLFMWFTGPRLKKVRAISLEVLLRPLAKVDLIDLDIQGAELTVLAACPELLQSRVKRVHVGTHSRDIEEGLRQLFRALGWKNIHDFPSGREVETAYGRMAFQDGVQSWVNTTM